ncbi:MAG: hypothetical protein U0136_00825 [Bdellovibrionota bacterium]
MRCCFLLRVPVNRFASTANVCLFFAGLSLGAVHVAFAAPAFLEDGEVTAEVPPVAPIVAPSPTEPPTIPVNDVDCSDPPTSPRPVVTGSGDLCWGLKDEPGEMPALDPQAPAPVGGIGAKPIVGFCCHPNKTGELGGPAFCPPGTSGPILGAGSGRPGICCSSQNMPNPNFPKDGNPICIPDPYKRPKPEEPDYDQCKARAIGSWPRPGMRKDLSEANTVLSFCCAGKVAERIGSDGDEDKTKLCGTCCDQGTPYQFESPVSGTPSGPGDYNKSCMAACDGLATSILLNSASSE